ncbi:uncharacterized protein PAN0_002d1022 [Moesziomyces antarcticus]|uniref:uncharacterized protein n=1 Tax=Pseudozyma antarctica TaxID=84753 RepID=UPI0007196ECB|nr:uncharacterized protein PAN0_002d1022 [Moesziomyces antarcticus]GAK62820.1 hypothetical protein PAN0_002d1022 [Moesziomyces antarcticus]
MHLAGGPRVHALRSAPIVISGLISSRLPRLCSAQPSPPETRQGWKIAASAAAGQTEIRGAPSFISPFAISPDQPAASASVSPPSAPAIPSHLRRPGHCSSLLRPAAPPPVSADCRSRSGTYLPPACHRSLFGSLCIAFAYDRPLPSSSSSAALPPPPPRHMHPSPSACCLASAVPLPPAPPVSSGGMNPHAPLPLHAYRWCGCGDHRGYAPPCPSSARPVPRACVPLDGFPCPPPPSLRPTVPGGGQSMSLSAPSLSCCYRLCVRECVRSPLPFSLGGLRPASAGRGGGIHDAFHKLSDVVPQTVTLGIVVPPLDLSARHHTGPWLPSPRPEARARLAASILASLQTTLAGPFERQRALTLCPGTGWRDVTMAPLRLTKERTTVLVELLTDTQTLSCSMIVTQTSTSGPSQAQAGAERAHPSRSGRASHTTIGQQQGFPAAAQPNAGQMGMPTASNPPAPAGAQMQNAANVFQVSPTSYRPPHHLKRSERGAGATGSKGGVDMMRIGPIQLDSS